MKANLRSHSAHLISALAVAAFLLGPTLAWAGLAGDCPTYRGRHYEVHYGFVNELFHSGTEEPILFEVTVTPLYDGTKCAGPFCAALHLTSELLWETGDPNSALSPDYCVSPERGSYHTSLRWQSRAGTAGDAWDGLSFVFGYPPNDLDGAKLRIDLRVTRPSGEEVYRLNETYTARQFEERFPQVYQPGGPQPPHRIPLTPEGHEIEFGAHFSLAYRLYDFLLFWGYGDFTHVEETHTQTCQNPSWPLNISPLENWQGRLSLAGGLIHPVQGRYLKAGEDQVTDCQGNAVTPGQLLSELCFESFVKEKVAGNFRFEDDHHIENGNAKALSVNLVVPTAAFNGPKESWPVFSVHVAGEGQTLINSALPVEPNRDPVTEESLGGHYQLPWRWASIDAVFRCADTKHVVHGHEHWCWFKHEY